MYKVVCDSYDTFTKSMPNSYRTDVMRFLALIKDVNIYEEHKKDETAEYKQLSDFLFRIKDCKKCYTISDELDARGISAKSYNIISDTDFEEQHKIFHMFLNLVYWR